jgi:hypothetical protein
MRDLPSWVRIGGVTDGLLIGGQSDGAGPVVRPLLEDCLLSVWTQPFAWLLLAEPVPLEETGRLADDVADRAYTARSMAERSPENAVEAARLERRHRELRQAATTGLWRVHLLAGGTSPQAAARVAALVCASADLDGLPYALAPLREEASQNAAAWPFEASSRLVAALARPPVREVPGVRFVVRPEFDVTPEIGAGGVPLGRVPSVDAVVSLGLRARGLVWRWVPTTRVAHCCFEHADQNFGSPDRGPRAAPPPAGDEARSPGRARVRHGMDVPTRRRRRSPTPPRPDVHRCCPPRKPTNPAAAPAPSAAGSKAAR